MQSLTIILLLCIIAFYIFIKSLLDHAYTRGKKAGRKQLRDELTTQVEVFMINQEHQIILNDHLKIILQELNKQMDDDIRMKN